MVGVAMVNVSVGGVRLTKSDDLKRSNTAEKLSRWATLSYWLAFTVAVILVLVAAPCTLLSPEQLAQRLLAFGVLGMVPALVTYMVGCLTCLALRGASVIYDPLALALEPVRASLTNLARVGWHVLAQPAMDRSRCGAANAIRFLISCRPVMQVIYHAMARYLVLAGASCAYMVLHLLNYFGGMTRYFGVIWQAFIFSVTFPVRVIAQILLRLIPSDA